MTLVPTLKQRLAAPSHLVDLTRLDELRGIALEGGVLRIGAATRHAEVAGSAVVRDAIPALAYLAGLIADPQVRNRGTMGGSVANNDPAADFPAAVLGLGATVVTSARRLPADDFFVDMFETALAPGEMVVAIEYPLPQRAAYAEISPSGVRLRAGRRVRRRLRRSRAGGRHRRRGRRCSAGATPSRR
jgi:carbon-monoxide dehydrogenase medium subunit